MGNQKNLYDVIYLTDKELGFSSNKTRPCIIMQLDESGGDENYVLPMTSQKPKHSDVNVDRILLSNGSYVNKDEDWIGVTNTQILYGGLAEIYLTQEDIDNISMGLSFDDNDDIF